MPELRSLLIGDTTASWVAAGFDVSERHGRARTAIGDVTIELVGPDDGRGIVAWRFDALGTLSEDRTIDGVRTLEGESQLDDDSAHNHREHANLVSHLDHVVMFTPDLQRTVAALEAAGFEARRTRDVPGTEPLRQQVFFWAGSTIIELVGPAEPTGDGPATLWGLAVTCDDLDAAHDRLDGRLGTPKAAVQAGRRIATLRTRDLGVSTAIAFMSPHGGSSDAQPDA